MVDAIFSKKDLNEGGVNFAKTVAEAASPDLPCMHMIKEDIYRKSIQMLTDAYCPEETARKVFEISESLKSQE
jgi:hypothetical protein